MRLQGAKGKGRNEMTIIEAMENALSMLEALGYKSGDIHDDLALAINRLKMKYPKVAKEEM
jgi:hypothetical protein